MTRAEFVAELMQYGDDNTEVVVWGYDPKWDEDYYAVPEVWLKTDGRIIISS